MNEFLRKSNKLWPAVVVIEFLVIMAFIWYWTLR